MRVGSAGLTGLVTEKTSFPPDLDLDQKNIFHKIRFLPHRLVEGLLNLASASIVLAGFGFQDPPRKRTNVVCNFCSPPNEIKHSSA